MGATTMNEKGDDRRLALEQRAGADAPDAEAARVLKADHAARLQPLDPSLWADIGLYVLRSIPENRLLATAGGVAFFGLMAIFPALATIVSLYGLFADPHAIPERLAILAGVVPASVIGLLKQQVLALAENHISTLSIAFLIGFLVSMWSANSGVSALFDALNVVHGSKETRGLLQFYTRTLAITLGSVVYGLLVLIGVLPHVFSFVGFEPTRGEPRGNFSLAGDLAHRDDRTQHRLPHWSESQRCKVALGDAGQRACRRPVGRRVDDLHLVCRGIQQLQSNLWLLGRRRRFHDLDLAFGRDRSHRGGAGRCNRKANVQEVRQASCPPSTDLNPSAGSSLTERRHVVAPGIFAVSARSRALFDGQREALADGFNPGAERERNCGPHRRRSGHRC